MKLISKFKQLFCSHDYEYKGSRQSRKKMYKKAISDTYGDNSAQSVIIEVTMECPKCGKQKTEKDQFQ